jgi:hypothetical protein
MDQPQELGQVVPPGIVILKGHISSVVNDWNRAGAQTSLAPKRAHKLSEAPIASCPAINSNPTSTLLFNWRNST